MVRMEWSNILRAIKCIISSTLILVWRWGFSSTGFYLQWKGSGPLKGPVLLAMYQ